MKLLNRHRLTSQKGAAVVEFAIVVPLLLLFFFGIIEFSLLMYNKQVLTNASREGTRYGIIQHTPDRRTIGEIQDVVLDWAEPRLITFGADILEKNDGDIAVTACYAETDTLDCSILGNWVGSVPGANFGDKLKVSITYNYDFLLVPNIPLLGTENNLPGTISLNAETVMNYE